MENLKKLRPSKKLVYSKSTLKDQLKAFLVTVFTHKNLANPRLVLALSGGLDSMVLLNLLAECNKTLPYQLSAHHVHHGLSENADAWADFCAVTCAKSNIPFKLSKVKINKNSGLGIEATARDARYTALQATDANFISPDFILLAHHQDDQAETLLLQLARGAGVKGLAGMAAVNGKLLRPLLDTPRSILEAYAKEHHLVWVNDESNFDKKFDRNFMRHEILPNLEAQYPAIRQTISRSAQHLASANDLLDELAQVDALQAGFDIALLPNTHAPLSLTYLSRLSENRIKNCLRWWLGVNGLQMPSAQLLQQILQQLMVAKTDANIAIKVSETLTLRRYQQRAYLVQDLSPNPPIDWLWQGEDTITLPNKTQLTFSKKMGAGIRLCKIENANLRIKFRVGGERFMPELGRPRRSLKVMLQNHEMPPWQRDQLPLIFMDETLVIIPNVGVDASLQANHDEMGLSVKWSPQAIV